MEIAVERIETIERQRAPHELNDEETEVWAAVVNSRPADWFSSDTAPLLTQYCREVIQARRVAEMIERATSDPELSIKDYDRLLKMQARQSATIRSLATTMRISQQATTNHRGNKKITSARKPWEG
ncbi:hypothetical protein NA8A_23364 [Nitratireductor indicus C115]|uniref:Uncharacterized protein n=2 Tax=Nitratireductor indicus TaxID=721133 RepID=K2MXE3_9HYPH|nr:hypothetical protein NA8A_23364 [Nitratireductor indicus C115]